MNFKVNRGITLITLVISIVVLLIISSITISVITDEHTVVDKSGQAKLSIEAKSEMEEIQKKIDNASSKGIKYGNYSGNLDAKTIQGELKNLVTDTSMITGNGPWQVTGTKTGTNYLIKQSYQIIPMPEETGTLTEMNVQVGDFVNYDAGTWTQEEIDKLGNLYSGEKIPDENNPYTFGGFKAGQSKNNGIIMGENNVAEIDEEHSGWRVLKINDDGSINIIHAGCPEWYYHPTRYNGSTYKSCYRSLYIFGGGKSEDATEDSFEGVFERAWKVYENTYFCFNNNAHIPTVDELALGGWTGAYTGSSSTDWIRKIGITFWTKDIYPSAGGIFVCNASNGSMRGYRRASACGIRPVVTLKAECLFQNANDKNTTTHDTQETAWNLVI